MAADIHLLRTALKPVLARFPALRRTAGTCYRWLHRWRDASLLRARHPEAEIIRYDAERMASLRRDGFHSQFGQDYFLWTRHLSGATNGRFVEIGCAHPTHCSNSYFFEKKGWRGHAIDAQDVFADLWRSERKSRFHHAAIAGRDGTSPFVQFARNEGWECDHSGFADVALPEKIASMEHRVIDVACRRLSTLLPDLGAIDLLMIDVEGAEREVLGGIDLDVLSPKCILIENNRTPGGDEDLRREILAHGYRLTARIAGVDDVFVKQENAA